MCLNHFPAAPPCAFLGLGWGPRPPLPHPEPWWVWWRRAESPQAHCCVDKVWAQEVSPEPLPHQFPNLGVCAGTPTFSGGGGATRTDPTVRGKEVTALPASLPGGTQVGAQAQPAGGGLGVTPAQQVGWGPRTGVVAGLAAPPGKRELLRSWACTSSHTGK